jgi:hypothetical protein
LNSRLVVALSAVVIVLIAAAFLVNMQQGASTTSTGSQTSTTVVLTGGSSTNASEKLQLRLSVNASTGGPNAALTIRINADEYNTFAAANNVSVGSSWRLNGLSLGECGTGTYPFGVALYPGVYTTGNVSEAVPLRIYPVVACPALIRYVTGYLFQPTSDLAVVLPSGPNATATPMSANVTATTEYTNGGGLSSSQPLGPGTYTVAAGDEWGSVVVLQVRIGAGGASSTTGAAGASTGTLGASFSIGPTAPVCKANASIGPAPQPYSSIEMVVSSSPSGQVTTTVPINWVSNGCEVSGVVQASLAPGSYSVNLSSCTYMGCSSAFPKSVVIVAGQSVGINVSIDTGIR